MHDRSLSSVGDHFMVGLRPGPTLGDHDCALLEELRPAGVILFKSNFLHDVPYDRWLESHRALVDSIRDASRRDRLFIAIDHEGGRVCRTPAPMTRYAHAAHWAATAGAVADSMGRELSSLGINLNFGPVLDIHSNPANPVIGERAFGTTPEAVVAAAIPFIAAMERRGVRACGKHFPGHGDTRADSHSELPVVDLSAADLQERELKPFVAAVRAGIGMLMTSHIMFRAIDGTAPVTLSRTLTHDMLRSTCGFDGVIVSDDIGMHAMDGMLDDPGTIARFMAAGNDMMMICSHWTDTGRARAFAHALVAARETGVVDAAALAASRQRIGAMLSGTPQHTVQRLEDGDFAAHRRAGALFGGTTAEVV